MDALFPVPASDDSTEAAMLSNLDAWQAAGKPLGAASRRALIDQAIAVDLARASRRATQISGANRVLLELMEGFGLLTDHGPAATDDPFQRWTEQILADNDAAAGSA